MATRDSGLPQRSEHRRLLAESGDRGALDDLFSAAYEELRRLAATVRRNDPAATLSPTALVNEAWLKLADSPAVARTSPLHFKRIAARAMRQVLVESARRRDADKRGGGAAVVTFDDAMSTVSSVTTADEVLGLDAALEALALIEPRQALMVESRFFGGLDVAETAELLGVSEATVLRDWRAAKAWLSRELRHRRMSTSSLGTRSGHLPRRRRPSREGARTVRERGVWRRPGARGRSAGAARRGFARRIAARPRRVACGARHPRRADPAHRAARELRPVPHLVRARRGRHGRRVPGRTRRPRKPGGDQDPA